MQEVPERRLRWYWPLAGLCAAGAILRVLVMATYSSAVFQFYNGDSIRYARIAAPGYHTGVFSDPYAPAGYPAVLKLLRAIWTALPFTVGVQHALGIMQALLLYAIARRLGAARGVALVPAGVVLLSGDQVFLEHALLSETLWAVLVTSGIYALIRGARAETVRLPWLAGAGLLLGGSALVRQISVPLVVLAVLWVALTLRRRLTMRAVAVALALTAGSAAAVLGLYAGVAHLEHGISGLGGRSGFQLYGRVAQFAECSDFHPPGRTRVLCQATAPDKRPGLVAQLYDPSLPLVARFHPRGSDDALLRRFALQAIVNQPGAYLGAVLADWEAAAGLRSQRRGEAGTAAMMRFSSMTPYGGPAPTIPGIAAYYRRAYTSVRALPLEHWAPRLGRYQSILRVHQVLVIPLLLITLAGLLLSRGAARSGMSLILALVLGLYLLPPLANGWDVRYGVLPGELLSAGAAVGGWFIYTAAKVRRNGTESAQEDQPAPGAAPVSHA